MDLEGRCYIGTYTTRVKNQRPFSYNVQVDLGYDDPESRHTLHYVPDEYDEMSNYQLRTCPEGYITSVRLGDGGDGDGRKCTRLRVLHPYQRLHCPKGLEQPLQAQVWHFGSVCKRHMFRA